MQIDAHQHFWEYSPAQYDWMTDDMAALRRDFLPAEASREMRAAGVDACIAVQVRQSLDENVRLLWLAETYGFIAGVVGWVDLRASNVRQQLAMFARQPKLVGIRHIVQSERDDAFLVQPEFVRGIAALAEFDLVYDLLIYPRHLPYAVGLVARLPTQRFVLDHCAKPEIRAGRMQPWARDLRRLASYPNVFCKVSGLVTEADWQAWTPEQLRPYLDVVWDAFGASRLIMGTDWPVCTLASDYRQVVDVIDEYLDDRPPSERHLVLGGTADRVWRLGERGNFASSA